MKMNVNAPILNMSYCYLVFGQKLVTNCHNNQELGASTTDVIDLHFVVVVFPNFPIIVLAQAPFHFLPPPTTSSKKRQICKCVMNIKLNKQ
jgi:hypothetical protein